MKKYLFASLLAVASSPCLFAGAGPGPWANGAYYPGQLDGRYFANVYNNLGGTFSRVSTTNTFFTTNQVVTTTITNVGGLPTTNIITTNVVEGPFFATNTVVTGSVVSGLINFGIRDGSPSTVSGTTAATGAAAGAAEVAGIGNASSALASTSLDRSINNFLVYVNGDVYVGTTAANIDPDSSTVSGILANGAGRTRYQIFTNQEAGVAAVANVGIEVVSIPSATANGYFGAKVKNNKSPYTFDGSGTIAIATSVGAASEVDGTHDFQLNGIKTSGIGASASSQTSQTSSSQ